MEQVQGKVSYIGSKTLDNGVVLYSMAIAGRDGFLLCGDQKPDAQKGQKVSVVVNGNKADMDTFMNLGWPDKKQGQSQGGGQQKAGGGGTSRDQYWERKEEKDEKRELVMALQNARYSALQTLQLAKDLDAIQLPAKKAAKLGALDEMIEEYTDKYFRQNMSAEEPGVDAPKATKEANEEQQYSLDDFNDLDEI